MRRMRGYHTCEAAISATQSALAATSARRRSTALCTATISAMAATPPPSRPSSDNSSLKCPTHCSSTPDPKHTLLLLCTWLKAVLSCCEHVAKDRNTRDYLEGESVPCTRCVSHTGYLTHGNSKGEAREEADTRIIVEELYEIWKEGTWAL